MTTPVSETAVRLQSAYEAAVERVRKTTDALILAEAQILDLTRQLKELGEENTGLHVRLDGLERPSYEAVSDGPVD